MGKTVAILMVVILLLVEATSCQEAISTNSTVLPCEPIYGCRMEDEPEPKTDPAETNTVAPVAPCEPIYGCRTNA
ncbi:hypothetical protein ACP275_08G120500 [Erythranthe tilingii]